VEHGDSMGNHGAIAAGDVQWMTAGSGIIHQEMPKGDQLVSGKPLQEPVAWYGPIVMNTQEQLRQAFDELERGTLLKPKM
jgi:redox-sensitive bicupin YhaK (pirin superfamily)